MRLAVRRLAAGGEHQILVLAAKALCARARWSRSSRPDISGVNSISAPPAAASATASTSARAFAAGSMPVFDWKSAILVIGRLISSIELAVAIERDEVVAPADMLARR